MRNCTEGSNSQVNSQNRSVFEPERDFYFMLQVLMFYKKWIVAEGKSSKEIAGVLNLSTYTVETHRSNIMQKLNLKGIPELILYAVRKGLIS